MSEKLENAEYEIQKSLSELSNLFTDNMKLTFIARNPNESTVYLIIGDDDVLSKIIEDFIQNR